MRIIRTTDPDFDASLAAITSRGAVDASDAERAVRPILDAVRERGDDAIADYTMRFDGVDVRGAIEVTPAEMDAAVRAVPPADMRLIRLAARRITAFHKRHIPRSWLSTDGAGARLGVRVTAIERAGIYVPGGKAAYPSTVLMNAIPARAAGVDEIVMATPPGKDGIAPLVLAAARVAGVDRVFRVGGAQAVAAMAYGTKTVPRADKITGPGNIFVATAKRLVYGLVDIDMIAGPSEILIINDGSGDPDWLAADLLSQAEHDELASSMLVTTSAKSAYAVAEAVRGALRDLKRARIAEASIGRYGVIIVARSLKEAASIANRVAPEHLELFVKKPLELLSRIRNAGAVFLGGSTPEAAGDYLAGPNHTLPTGGTARFSSPLGVEDFIKRTSVIGFSEKAVRALGPSVARFAALEGLDAHSMSMEKRLKPGRTARR